ncbi:MAG: cytochrome c [Magnetococcales bacterium]|nr:cytochrome c [Magnetococcales bacterium]
MNTIARLLPFLLLVATAPASAADAPPDDPHKQAYIQSVVTVLRIHADALEQLVSHDFKYSDNLVRHAVALRQTFGLLGPMDWHAARSAYLVRQQNPNDALGEDTFERMAQKSQKMLKRLELAAHEFMEEHDRESLLEAVRELKNSCTACHGLLPAGVAPDVWAKPGH